VKRRVQGSGFGVQEKKRKMEAYRRIEELVVFQECIRMLNGMERTLEKQLPEPDRRWPQTFVREGGENYGDSSIGFSEP